MNNFHINQYTIRKFCCYFHGKCLAVVLGIAILSTFVSNHSTGQPVASANIKHPDWAKNATIYEVNIRQYSPEGTFEAFRKDIPRLKKMGVEIIWLMPIHPIGKKNRKGKLGSPYSVRNYKAINPNFGTLSDLTKLVQTAHNNMKVILDWVANHTAWDNVWTKTHPNWFTKDKSGHFKPPNPDWDDVIDLNRIIHQPRREKFYCSQGEVKNGDGEVFVYLEYNILYFCQRHTSVNAVHDQILKPLTIPQIWTINYFA